MDPIEALRYIVLPIGSFLISISALVIALARRMDRSALIDIPPDTALFVDRAPALFSRLAKYGFIVCPEHTLSIHAPAKVVQYAVCYHTTESVEPCRACKQRGTHAFGETMSAGGRPWDRVEWLGHVCTHCGHMERYYKKIGGGGFFGLMLQDADRLLDLIAALDDAGDRPLVEKMACVLAEREAIHLANAEAIGRFQLDLIALGFDVPATPFR